MQLKNISQFFSINQILHIVRTMQFHSETNCSDEIRASYSNIDNEPWLGTELETMNRNPVAKDDVERVSSCGSIRLIFSLMIPKVSWNRRVISVMKVGKWIFFRETGSSIRYKSSPIKQLTSYWFRSLFYIQHRDDIPMNKYINLWINLIAFL